MQVIKGRYEAEGHKHETNEFLKPIIVDPEGLVKGTAYQQSLVCCVCESIKFYFLNMKMHYKSSCVP